MKRILKITLKIIASLIVVLTISIFIVINQKQFGQLPEGKRLERIENSPNYKDGEFKNLSETSVLTSEKSTFKTMVDFMFSEKENVTPKYKLPTVKTNLKALNESKDVLVWLGHSSYFIRLNGVTFLIDPVLSGYASPFSFMNKSFDGTDIYKSNDIPEIDYLIISHDHWDHLDYETVLELESKVKHVICGLGVGQHFEYWGYNPSKITELDWYQNVQIMNEMIITATPARHYSGRGLDRNKTLWASYVLESPTYNIYMGGDSGYDEFYKKIGEDYGPFNLTILEQGQYSKNWKQIHLLPSEVFKAGEELNSKSLLPVHNSKFALANHLWSEPLEAISKNPQLPVKTPKIGEPVMLRDSTQMFTKWWEVKE